MEQFPNVRLKKSDDNEVPEKQTIRLSINKDNIYNEKGYVVATVRGSGEFKGKAIYLNDKYKWIVGTDNEGCMIAIPLEKVI